MNEPFIKFSPKGEKKIISNPLKEVILFEQNYGWFYSKEPLISRVTESHEHKNLVRELLQALGGYQDLSLFIQTLTASEIITKVLAYRELRKEDRFLIPVEGMGIEEYTVEKVFDLWNGMPAFGLVPTDVNRTALLLFRGTDISLKRKGSWSSLISDIDILGPGYSVFQHAQKEIRSWLIKQRNLGIFTRVMGFSLGGILAAYTVLHEGEYLTKDPFFPSVAFNPPGISRKILDQNSLASDYKSPFIVFITKNDLVSKTGGMFIGDVFELNATRKMQPVEAHVGLISAELSFEVTPFSSC